MSGLDLLFARAFKNGLFQVNAGTRRKATLHTKNPKLNRSARWPYAETYEGARRMSPFPHRPVR